MVGRIEFEPERGTLRISFPYRPDLVELVRELPGRFWDKAGKAWRVPAAHVEQAVSMFLAYGFELTPEVSTLLAQGGPPAPAAGAAATATATAAPPAPAAARGRRGRKAEAPTTAAAADTLTVSGLNALVQGAIAGRFPDAVWVVGEVQNYDKNKHQKHRFFELVEKDQGGTGQKARATAVLFESAALRVERKSSGAGAGAEPFELRDGIEIRARVKVELYAPRGQYQLVIEDVDTAFTLGKLELLRKQILTELEALGLRDRNRSLPLPALPLRIALLTSADSDALNDFVTGLKAGGLAFLVTHVPVAVQGEGLESSMLAGLSWFARRAAQFDVLCIVRGGGSRTDLAWFDNLPVALAVARHPLKIVCGIGHQRDASVLDLIAHSEQTPTAAAALLVRLVQEAQQRLAARLAELLEATRARLRLAHHDLVAAARRFALAPRSALRSGHEDLAHRLARVSLAASSLVRGRQRQLVQQRGRIPILIAVRTARETERLEARARALRALDPRAVLRRGFALLRDASGRVRTRVAELRAGMAVRAELQDGSAHATITRVEPGTPEA